MDETPETKEPLFNDEGWNKLIAREGLTLICADRSFENEATMRSTLEKIVETLLAEAKQNGLTPWSTDSLHPAGFTELELGTKELGIIDRSGVIMPVTDLRMWELAKLAETMPIVLVCQRAPSLSAQRKPYSIVEVRFVAKPAPAILLVQVKNREGENTPEMLFDAVTGDLTELSRLGAPDCCADLEDEDEEANIKLLAEKLATLNQRLVPGREKEAVELATVWLADPKRDDVNLAVTLASAGVSECTAKEARQEKKGVLWKLSAKFDAEYFAHIRPEYVARCESGIPITLAERKEMRGNSWEVAYLAQHLDDEALLSAARYAGDNSRICLSRATRWDVPTTYDDAVFMIYLPLLLERVEKLSKHNALMREKLIELASSPVIKGEVAMMEILAVADNTVAQMAERAADVPAVDSEAGDRRFAELAPPMTLQGAYSSGYLNPATQHTDAASLRAAADDIELPGGAGGGVVATRRKRRAEGCKVQLQIAESTRYPGKPSIRVEGAPGEGERSHEFREALISAGYQIGDRAVLKLVVAEGCFEAASLGDAVAVLGTGRASDEAWAHSPGCTSPENHDGPCPEAGGFVKPTEPAQLSVWDNLELAGYREPADKETT